MSQTSDYPKPLWPLPEGMEKPKIRVTKEGLYETHYPDGIVTTTERFLDDAINYAQDEVRYLSLESEYTQRREALARFLCDLVYGEGAWEEAGWQDNADLLLNYRLDADDIIKANPHLLSLGERERLAGQIPELAYP